jgi:hypothetical protein
MIGWERQVSVASMVLHALAIVPTGRVADQQTTALNVREQRGLHTRVHRNAYEQWASPPLLSSVTLVPHTYRAVSRGCNGEPALKSAVGLLSPGYTRVRGCMHVTAAINRGED